ncbi:MAG: VPGUxxT family thioredoxin-like (seleno)protein, type 2 [Planctomycetota bacterium]|nr:VPGUxxT family thioredoxin-like (seleno)protein, type 2 [Planctomycetota bacterium]
MNQTLKPGLRWPLRVLALVALTATATAAANGEAPGKPASTTPPPELGDVKWARGFDNALAHATSAKRPLLVLFQEVPGCGTCINYGQQVLSHPLIVEAAESLFLPVAVYNNIPGPDEKTLKSFKEKAWNNPVVRIISPDCADLAPKVAGNYTVAGLAKAMVHALRNFDRDIPPYLELLSLETTARARGVERATFAMHCFWEGEGALGRIPGVVGTLPGFLDKMEVVEVEFDPRVVDYRTLVRRARSVQCASRVFTRSDDQQKTAAEMVGRLAVRSDDAIRPDKEPKYYLSKSPMRFVPMTGLQACRVNAAVGAKGDARSFLSPRQVQLLALIQEYPKAGWSDATGRKDLVAAWTRAAAIAQKLRHKVP